MISVRWNEDSTATALGRLTARNGSGAATGVDGEGNWLQQADISTIVRTTYDLTDGTGTAANTDSLTVSSAVLDTPVTTAVIWTEDAIGYNFIDDIPASYFPTGGSEYRVEYKVTLTGGEVFHGVYQGRASRIAGS